MLKIHSFLRKMRDSLSGTIWTMIKKHSRSMAIAAYTLTAVILVLHFEKFTTCSASNSESIPADAAGLVVNAAEEENENEETKLPGSGFSGNAEYPLLTKNEYYKLNIFPLGQAFVGSVITSLEDCSAAMAVQTAKDQQERMTKEEDLQLFSVNAAESKNKAVKEPAEDATSVISSDVVTPKTLSNSHNKMMVKKLSEEEITVLQRIVEAEATGEDVYGKILVANVVLNRVNSKHFPDTVSDVVFQKSGSTYQFSPTKDGRYWKVKISKSTKEAVNRALSGEDYSKGALYFFARRLTSSKKASWFDTSLKRVVQYGCHEFYKNK